MDDRAQKLAQFQDLGGHHVRTSDDFNVDSFKIGWRSNDSDIRIWAGGSGAGLDLEGSTIEDLEDSLGFTQLPDFWNVAVNTATDLNTDVTGRVPSPCSRLVLPDSDISGAGGPPFLYEHPQRA